jgi:nucleotide-binding universal stress UspA family protein
VGPIVCATRGGEASRRTQERAIGLAKERKAELIFLCVFDPVVAERASSELAEAVAEEQQWLGRALMGIAKKRAQEQGLGVEVAVRRGAILETIEAFVCEVGADTLVIGEPKTDSPLAAFHPGTIVSCARQVEQNTGIEVVVVTPDD